jgi:hypothetical protein
MGIREVAQAMKNAHESMFDDMKLTTNQYVDT